MRSPPVSMLVAGAAFVAAALGLGGVPPAAGSEAMAVAPAPAVRFHFHGDGVLRLYHAHFGVEAEFRFRGADGTYDEAVLEQLQHFFRSRTDGALGPLSLRLVEMLDYVEDRFAPRRLVLYSAYRSPELNAQLAGTAQTSLHVQGLAADVGLEGLDLRAVWDELRHAGMGGVGLYPGGEVLHLDAGPARFWESGTARVGENLSAGNARIFARTEFDRYDDLDRARITLHSTTVFPLGLRRALGAAWELEPEVAGVPLRDGCWWLAGPEVWHRFRVRVGSGMARLDPPPASLELTLVTCEPRPGATPETVATNRIDLVVPAPAPAEPPR